MLHRWGFPSVGLAAIFGFGVSGFGVSLPAVAQTDSIANLPPENSPFVLIVDTQVETWQEMTRFELFAKLEAQSQQVFHPGSMLFSPMHLDYANDVQPWIGDEAALVLLPMARVSDIHPSERTLLVASIAHGEAFEPMLAVLGETRAVEPQELSYKGVSIWVWQAQEEPLEPTTEPCSDINSDINLCEPWFDPYVETLPSNNHLFDQPFWYLDTARQTRPPAINLSEFETILESGQTQNETYIVEPGLAIAHLNDHVVMAENLETLKLWIEYQQSDGPSLRDNPTFRAAQSDPASQDAIAQIYGDVGELTKYSFDLPLSGLPFFATFPSENLLEQAATLRALEDIRFQGWLYPQSEGLRLTAKLYGNELAQALQTSPMPAQTGSILRHLPANTYFLFSGQNLGGLWRGLTHRFNLDQIASNWLESARSAMGISTELDLNGDVLAWMDGEYSFFFIPSQQGLLNTWLPGINLEMGLLVQTRDRNAATTAISTLDTWTGMAQSNPLHNQAVVNWIHDLDKNATTTHDQTNLLSHTWVSEDTIAITTGSGAMNRLLNPVGFAPLTEHSTFTKATATLPQPNYGYGYVNMAPTLSLFYNSLGWNSSYGYFDGVDPYVSSFKGMLGSVYSLSFTTASTEAYWQADALVGLAPREQR
jgi:Protein of unknown function (DUF3352)